MAYYFLHSGQPSAKRLLRHVSRLRTYQSSNAIGRSDVLIRWGPSSESDPSEGYVVNPQTAIARTSSRAGMGRFLRRVGIRFTQKDAKDPKSGDPIRFLRHYRVPVFDMKPLACFRSDSNSVWLDKRLQRVQDSFREIGFNDEKVTIRIISLATRTLHALGLDCGLVSIGMAPRGVLHVLDVVANPVLEGRMLDLYSSAVNEFLDNEERADRGGANPVMLGTDVELMLRNAEGKMVLASRYFPRKGKVGCDDRSIQFDGKRLPLVELRPDPDPSPIGLLANLRNTLADGVSAINRQGVEWRAGSMPFRPYCTGGHIHFSNVPFSSRFVWALDNYVGLPLMLVEDRRTARLRRPHYGFLGDVRHKAHGGFEYRTPASFVVNMDVTAAALCLAYLVAVHHRELPWYDLSDPNIQSAFYKGDIDVLQPLVERNFAALRALPLYERYRDYIEPLVQMIREGKTWDETADVRAVWGVPLERRATERSTRRHRVRARSTG